jgi:hypothetical protein
MNPGGATAKNRTQLRALRKSVVVLGFYGVLIAGLLWAFSFWGAGETADGKGGSHGAGEEFIGSFVRSAYTPRKAVVAHLAQGADESPIEDGNGEPPVELRMTESVSFDSITSSGILIFDPPWDFYRDPVVLKLRRYRNADGLPTAISDNYGWIASNDDKTYTLAEYPVLIDMYPGRSLEFSVLTIQSMGAWDEFGNPIVDWAETSRFVIPANSDHLRLTVNLRNFIRPQKFLPAPYPNKFPHE